MTRLFIALTLLLMSFLSALDHLDWLRNTIARVGVHRGVPELMMAASIVAVFAHLSSLHRRLLFPRRGAYLLAAGIVVYAVGLAAANGLLAAAAVLVPTEQGSPWADVPTLVAGVYPQFVLLAAQLLLVLGAFRALSNLVPPAEFKEDF
jgi:hypothetical protein